MKKSVSLRARTQRASVAALQASGTAAPHSATRAGLLRSPAPPCRPLRGPAPIRSDRFAVLRLQPQGVAHGPGMKYICAVRSSAGPGLRECRLGVVQTSRCTVRQICAQASPFRSGFAFRAGVCEVGTLSQTVGTLSQTLSGALPLNPTKGTSPSGLPKGGCATPMASRTPHSPLSKVFEGEREGELFSKSSPSHISFPTLIIPRRRALPS